MNGARARALLTNRENGDKLTPEQDDAVRFLFVNFRTKRDIARDYGLNARTVDRAIDRSRERRREAMAVAS